MRRAACAGVSPATCTSPIIGKSTVPRSDTRASVVRSGLRKTVMRTMSPMPSDSRRRSGVAIVSFDCGCAMATAGARLGCVTMTSATFRTCAAAPVEASSANEREVIRVFIAFIESISGQYESVPRFRAG